MSKDERATSLSQIEWLLTKSLTPGGRTDIEQPYGDLTEINTSRLILDSVGKDILRDIAGDYLDLLDTSAAVYEKNGDYAAGIFSSGWCRLLDRASRDLCGTDDNRPALAGGKWLCHESCWTDTSKPAIETGRPVDIECNGGIRLYGVPVFAGDDIVGSIDFGYGDPPKDDAKLREIAEKYKVDVAALRQASGEYQSRPPFFLDLAKNRLQHSATLIGEITRRSQAEKTIRDQAEAAKFTTPVLQVKEGLLAVPIIGRLDNYRARQLTEQMLKCIREARAKAVVLDITGVPVVDSAVANHLIQTVQAARLLGASVIITGVSPANAQTLVRIGVDLSRVRTTADLQDGIEESEKLLRITAADEAA
ncbi:MAG: STAS domain-containing protein [Actinomycetota bacterium]|nr:STAS domain-containing protein [Actinomycetota bacterium]